MNRDDTKDPETVHDEQVKRLGDDPAHLKTETGVQDTIAADYVDPGLVISPVCFVNWRGASTERGEASKAMRTISPINPFLTQSLHLEYRCYPAAPLSPPPVQLASWMPISRTILPLVQLHPASLTDACSHHLGRRQRSRTSNLPARLGTELLRLAIHPLGALRRLH
ncbi:hypothetical protein BD324DRAFT_617198, partial [Kockovaella imperatae]